MEAFDFNAPIDVTIIFDDSDEETNPVLQKTQTESQNGSVPPINELTIQEKEIKSNASKTVHSVKTFESIEHNAIGQEISKCYTDAKKESSKQKALDMPVLDNELNERDVDFVTTQHDNNKISETQTTSNQTQKKRKQSTNERKPLKKRTAKEKKSCPIENNANISEPIENTEVNNLISQNYNQSQVYTEMSKSQTDTKEAEQTIVIDNRPNSSQHLNPFHLNTDILQSQPHRNQADLNYFQELLNVVSEHMLYIINSYHSYSRIYRNSVDRSLILLAKNNFLRTKHHFFNLSYSTVLNLIIPNEEDVTFVKNFLNTTVKIAQSKLYNYTFIHIEPLYIEMINWVKKRRELIQNMNLNKTPNPLLVQQLEKPPQIKLPPPYPALEHHVYKPNTEANRNNVLNTNVVPSLNFTSTPFYNMQIDHKQYSCPITITGRNTEGYGKQTHNTPTNNPTTNQTNHHLSYHLKQIGNLQNEQPQQYYNNGQQNYNNGQQYYNNGQQNYNNGQQKVPHKQKRNIQFWEKQATPSWQMQYNPQLHIQATQPAHMQVTQPVPIQVTQPMHMQATEEMHMEVTQPAHMQATQPVPIQATQPMRMQATEAVHKEVIQPVHMQATQPVEMQATQPMHMQATQPVEMQATQAMQKQATQPLQNFGNVLATQDSPQRFHHVDVALNNQYVAPENQVETNNRSSISRDSGFISPLNFNCSDQLSFKEEQRSEATPFITHVTSLNPNASYITEGSCAVCGNTTKTKCIGCYKCYYCSHYCQDLDWKNHMDVCK